MDLLDYDIFWAWGTIALTTLIAAGYCVIAFNWYFQTKLREHAKSQAALRKLAGISVSCILCGSSLYLAEMPWAMWRVYDALLVLVALRTWTFVFRTRGLSLVHEKVAQADQKVRAAQEYRQMARQKSFFLNALSHDLRAPLHNVLLNAHLLKMSSRDETDAESVAMIMENAVAAGDLVTKLLDLAKVGARDDNSVEPVSLTAVLNHVVRRFTPIAEEKELFLRLDASRGDEAVIATDRHKLERVVSNLVDNAIKYTKRGGVIVSLSARKDHIAVHITDTGIGIPADHVPYLFEEFYQVENHERDRSKGFGMGLAICRCLARHLGGDVRLSSTSREGSCFEVTIKDLGADRRGRPRSASCDRTAAEPAGAGCH
jgi:signal transduction histidine kinase